MFESRRRRSGSKPEYIDQYFTTEALGDGTFSFTKKGTGDNIQYSKDNGSTWASLASGETVSVVAGDKVMWKSTITPSSSKGIGTFSSSNNFNVCGNIMSLLYGDDFIGQASLEGKDYAFMSLFNNNSGLIDASKLILPATTLATGCYYSMFQNCTSLTTVPELPANRMATMCYYGMFKGCTSLTTAPELPATTLADSCYNNMFSYCTSLTAAPELPVTTLAKKCYSGMFSNCTSLTTAPELPATTLVESCYNGMFQKCTSLTTAPKLPATTLANRCYEMMFNRCTNLTTAPKLPATTLVENCYNNMFHNCTSLNHITMLANDVSARDCLQTWVYGVSSTGIFVKHPDMDSLPTGADGIPEGWTVIDASV